MYSLTFCVRFLLPERHQWKDRIPDCRSNVENAPRRRPVAGRARFPYTARGFWGAPVALRSPTGGARRRRLAGVATTPAVRTMSSYREIAGWTQA